MPRIVEVVVEIVRFDFAVAPMVKMRVLGFRDNVRSIAAGGDAAIVAVRFNVSANPKTDVRVMVALSEEPSLMVRGLGIAPISKLIFGIRTVTLAK